MNTIQSIMVSTVAAVPGTAHFQAGYVDMVLNAGLVAKMVLGLLLFFSLACWAIIFFKLVEFASVRRDTEKFMAIFQKKGNLSNIFASGKVLKASPSAMVFIAAYKDLVEIVKNRSKPGKGGAADGAEEPFSKQELSEIQRVVNSAASREITKLERKISFLATTGSTAPFIGLFGTVWGVMDAFRAIGIKGSASIAGVAPGISEALIATAAGLLAAVPAVIAFNYFNSRIRRFAGGIEEFTLEFMNLLERKFYR